MTRTWSVPSAQAGPAAHAPAQIVTLRLGKDQPGAVPLGLVGKVLAALRSWRVSVVEGRRRPLARVRARHAALGFPYRRKPVAAPVKPDRDCDCVPWAGL